MKQSQLYLSTVDENAASLCRKYGLGLELAQFCTAWNLDDEFPATDQQVKEQMKGIRRFTMHGPYNELFPCAIDKKARQLCRDRYLQTMEVAQGYGIHKIIFHAGFNPALYFPIWFTQQSILFFQDFVKEIPEDMTIALENVVEEDPAWITDILAAVDSPKLRMCLDVGHARAYSRFAPSQWVEKAAPFIDHFHIHNNDGSRDSHSPLMEGSIPMVELLSQIETQCPLATLTLELPEAESSVKWLLQNNILEETAF